MGSRLTIIGLVFVFAAGLAWLQNNIFVGSQELFAQIQQDGARQVELIFKDAAGNVTAATKQEVAQVQQRLQARPDQPAIPVSELGLTDHHTISFTAERDVSERELRQHLVHQPFTRPNPSRPWFHINRGIDLRGGVEFNFTLRDEDGTRIAADDDVIDILRQRLDARGLSEPQVYRLANGDGQVVIPGGSKADAARTRKVLETTGKLEFRELVEEFGEDARRYIEQTPDGRWRFKAGSGKQRTDRREVIYPEKPPRGENPSAFYHLGPVQLTGQDVADAFRTVDQEGGIAVGINFTVAGGARNNQFTTSVKARGPDGENRGTGRIAISLDGEVASAPFIQTPSTRSCQITGNFSESEVADLRQVLKAGSLAVKPEITSQRVVGPTLGHDTIVAGTTAMGAALLVVMAFIVVYYWWQLGTVAVASLATCIVLIVAAVSAFGATLTLPGMAGLVLTVGMAVDANILIFERIREEIGEDVDVATCVHAGYSRAFLTIFDANITTFLTAFVLYLIGSGPVKGFGLMLMIGIVTSMFGALYVGRALTDYLYSKRNQITVANRVPIPLIDYVRMRFGALVLSTVVIVGGLAWFGFGGKVARNFDIDFTGGNMVQVTLQESLTLEQVRDKLAATYASKPERFDLINPDNMQIQPYYASFAETGDATRQFMFKVRDDQATGIERKKQALEQEQVVFKQEIQQMEDDELVDRDRLDALEVKIAELQSRIDPLAEQLKNRVEDFQVQLQSAFAGQIGKEGDVVLAAGYQSDERELMLHLETLTLPAAAVLQQLERDLSELSLYESVQAEATETPRGVRVQARLHPDALLMPDVVIESAVSDRAQALLQEQDVASDQVHVLAIRAKGLEERLNDGLATGGVQLATVFPASDYFSPQVASQMQWRALGAMGASILAILIYIAMRFELRFGVGAIVALVHDVLATVGLLSVFGVRIDLTVVAALLTIIGYSLNDTIVVFDRIREVMRKTGNTVMDTLNDAVRQTMSRTILTSGTTLFAVLVLYLFGGDGINAFSATMLIGLVLGTYSSVFIAAPTLLLFKDKPLSPLPEETALDDGEVPMPA